jgi:hypothetical protein
MATFWVGEDSANPFSNQWHSKNFPLHQKVAASGWSRDAKMSVFCLTNQNPLSVLLGNEKSIVHIGTASFVRLFTEIAIGRSASRLNKLCLFLRWI